MTAPVVLNKANPADVSLALYGVFGTEVTAQSVSDALSEAKGAKRLTVYCDSPGGDLFTGFAILAQLERFAKTAEVVFVVEGLCASAATIAAMGATRVVMSESAAWMIHEARAVAGGTAADFAKMADVLGRETGKLVALYAKKTGKPVDEVAALLAAETWYTAAEAVAHHFADEILSETKPRPRAEESLVIEARTRVEDAVRALRMAAATAEVLRIRNLRSAASRDATPGQPGQLVAEQDPKEGKP